MLLVTIVTVLPNDNNIYALADSEIQGKKNKKKTTETFFYRYLVGLLVLGLMTVAAGVAAYVIYR